jgi:hypothetical protein
MTEKRTPAELQPKIKRFGITLHIDSGNLIYREFDNLAELAEFAMEYTNNHQKILEEITPKPNKKQIGDQPAFYEVHEDDEDE